MVYMIYDIYIDCIDLSLLKDWKIFKWFFDGLPLAAFNRVYPVKYQLCW